MLPIKIRLKLERFKEKFRHYLWLVINPKYREFKRPKPAELQLIEKIERNLAQARKEGRIK